MVDFYKIKERSTKNGVVEVYPDFKVVRSKDLMIRGKSFYAIWDEERGLWSTDEYDVQRLVDEDLMRHKKELETRNEGNVQLKLLSDFSSNSWLYYRNYVGHLSDSSHQLDEKLTFANTEVRKDDYVSKRLPYPLAPGDISAYDELVSKLYAPEERAKFEWAIGAVLAGDAKNIQKFLVFYGSAGTGKSTILNIIQKLFEGYYTVFDAKSLTGNNNAFATEAFKANPLVAIQHDGDLSKIEDNTKLNSIVSHEDMTMNEKYKPSYMSRINAFLFMGTNSAVKITDSKSGLIRRLIDVVPTGETHSPRKYQSLYSQIDFELGAIAQHCLDVYRSMGKDYYSGYKPMDMMLQTDVFFNFIEAYYDVFKEQNGATLNQAYEFYKAYCDESAIQYRLPKYKFREELKTYFDDFQDRALVNGDRVRSWFSGFQADHFKRQVPDEESTKPVFSLVMEEAESIFDKEFEDCYAQYSTPSGTPQSKWATVRSKLKSLDTTKEHYVKVPQNHIVIDFDLKDADGKKSAERNLEAASSWPSTYAEYSKSGHGIHLHYNYDGDASELSRVYDDNIEVKVFTGDSSLRRRLTRCNSIPVATLKTGQLPRKEKKVINSDTVKSEKALRDLIMRNLRKEFHAGTKPSMDFIKKILDDAYRDGLRYDVTDLRPKLMAFAANSTNQSLYCLKILQELKFKSEDVLEEMAPDKPKDERVVFYDVEVFPNLFVVCWKYEGTPNIVRMINPSPQSIEELLGMKLVGFNNRRYDNHILYGRFMGFDNKALYELSQKLINGSPNAYFREAYNLSYTDIYDFSSKKQGLKKWEIELGVAHKELGLPWDQPVPEEMWQTVAEYCDNDVMATEAVWNACRQDFVAREILAALSGLSLNNTTQQHASKIVFDGNKTPQEQFVYTDLSEMFPGYKYEYGKSYYKDEITGEGGYVYAEPGMYYDVAVLDVASMHPTSIEQLDLFGEYTKNFSALKAARIAIKRGELDEAKKMFDGRLAQHLGNEEEAEALAYALKIVINIVYGLTSAKFDNSFRDPRNIDNIVAKRGALFMIDLKLAVQAKGFQVVHIKTDSIKIPNATPEIIQFVMDFGRDYGYDFEHEATYEKFCLVNDAVYIAKTKPGRKPAHWEATGAQFQHPYVFKTLFSKEPITFKDKCETKQVTTALYLDFDADGVPAVYDQGEKRFVGKTGMFCPIKPGHGGGILLREKDGKFHAATGTKGYFWMESHMVKELNKEKDIDMTYFQRLVDEATDALAKHGDVESFFD